MRTFKGEIEEDTIDPIMDTGRYVCTCTRCNATWVSYTGIPNTCARCRSPYWRIKRSRKVNSSNSKDLKDKETL